MAMIIIVDVRKAKPQEKMYEVKVAFLRGKECKTILCKKIQQDEQSFTLIDENNSVIMFGRKEMFQLASVKEL